MSLHILENPSFLRVPFPHEIDKHGTHVQLKNKTIIRVGQKTQAIIPIRKVIMSLHFIDGKQITEDDLYVAMPLFVTDATRSKEAILSQELFFQRKTTLTHRYRIYILVQRDSTE